MQENEKNTYIAIDLKSFYASVECRERGLNPIKTNLVVADNERTEKTICLAVSPSLKSYGIPGRARLFEVVQKVKEINLKRKSKIPNHKFSGKSYNDDELKNNPNLELSYIIAKPRMAYYIKYSTKIYNIYLKYFSEEDIVVYSIDEIFCDVTHYLKTYKMTAKELVTKVIQDVYETTGITATAGIGTNLYLCKVAMDIEAKHVIPDKNGVRIAELDEMSYREKLWSHRPITDFWRVGKGYSEKLAKHGIYTMGDIARISINNEELLYKLFGINAELLIDHSWGWEPCTINSIKNYRPENKSISNGQVLREPYSYEDAKIIVKEMAEQLSLDLFKKKLVTNQIVLTVGYDVENLKNPEIRKIYTGEITVDYYGRKIPKHAHGTTNLRSKTALAKSIVEATAKLYDKIINKNLLIRRINISANNLENECNNSNEILYEQMDLFTNYEEQEKIETSRKKKELLEKNIQMAILGIKYKYGKNAVIKCIDLQKNATAIERNRQIGGHRE